MNEIVATKEVAPGADSTSEINGQGLSKVLLITLGTIPQVVTETVWALMQSGDRWIPDRILLLTTESSAQRVFADNVSQSLLGPGGRLERLGAALGVPDLARRTQVIRAKDADGIPLQDLRSARHIEIFAETLLRLVAEFTAQQGTVLHLSMAGGRKTMSFIAGQVMALFARSQDRLSHVLVHPAMLESKADFWWPDGIIHPDARIELHNVPFLRMRAWFGNEWLQGIITGGYARAVEIANEAVGEARPALDLSNGELRVAGTQVHLNPREAAILALAAIAGKRGQGIVTTRRWHPAQPKWASLAVKGDRTNTCRLWAWLCAAGDLPRIYQGFLPVSLHEFDKAASLLVQRMANGDGASGTEQTHPYGEFIGQPLSRLRRKLKTALPPLLAARIIDSRQIFCDLSDAMVISAPAILAEHKDKPAEIQITNDRITQG